MASQTTPKLPTTKDLFGQKSIQQRFEKLLGKKAPGFISSVLQVVNNSDYLAKADPYTILNAAATAAAMDLEINQNLGYAWIVPYKDGKSGKVLAQFQMGWKGFVQLAQRTGSYVQLNAIEVYENQFRGFNRLTEEIDANFSIPGTGKIVGYAAYFKLANGFYKMLYWTTEEVQKHAKKYSKTYGKSSTGWNDPEMFPAMAKKTLIKNILKWGPLSIEMRQASKFDQAVINEQGEADYIDNPENTIEINAEVEDEEKKRIKKFIDDAKDTKALNAVKRALPPKQQEMFKLELDNRENELILIEETQKGK